eukprot:TRINITY_DN95164_c0_g1_i1.p1 TRINITY_DN95164_c0_g1~~TRINITY_DN95164_c0_g1_i1.p1  ORF type:complete len:103 (-),score=15.84 TRINITY_DN95164_c0_g1_i1:13-321(-)
MSRDIVQPTIGWRCGSSNTDVQSEKLPWSEFVKILSEGGHEFMSLLHIRTLREQPIFNEDEIQTCEIVQHCQALLHSIDDWLAFGVEAGVDESGKACALSNC